MVAGPLSGLMFVELVVLVGLQGSGKSTFCRERFAGSHVVVSKDDFPRARRRERRQRRLVEAALGDGLDCMVDNTNPSPDEWEPLIDIGRRHGAAVVGYWFAPDVELSLARNARRAEGVRVPEVGVFATLKKLRKPRLANGFDLLYSVRADEGGGFVVEVLEAAE